MIDPRSISERTAEIDTAKKLTAEFEPLAADVPEMLEAAEHLKTLEPGLEREMLGEDIYLKWEPLRNLMNRIAFFLKGCGLGD